MAASPHALEMADLLAGYETLVRRLGYDPEALPGLEPAPINRSMPHISLRDFGALLETTANTLKYKDFGLRLTALRGDHSFGPLERLMSSAPTIWDALLGASEFSGAFVHGVSTFLERGDQDGAWFLRVELHENVTQRHQLVELLLLRGHRGLPQLSGGKARAQPICLTQLPQRPLIRYAQHFRAPVDFGQDFDGLYLSNDDLAAPVIGGSEAAFAAAKQALAAQFPLSQMPLETRVRHAVERGFADGLCTRERIAELLDMHERTLHRRLAQAGTSFQEIRDTVRRKLALRYLAQSGLTLNEITGRLGYSELPVLMRSCQRWFNLPPAELRRRLQKPDAGDSTPQNPVERRNRVAAAADL